MCGLEVESLKSAEAGVVGGQHAEQLTVEGEVPGLAHQKLIGWDSAHGLVHLVQAVKCFDQQEHSEEDEDEDEEDEEEEEEEGEIEGGSSIMAGISVSSLFGNLYFLLLTQMRIAHNFHPVPKPRISLNLLHTFEHLWTTGTEQVWEGWRIQQLKPLLLFSLLFNYLCWLMSEETPLYWTAHFFIRLHVHQHTCFRFSCTKSKPGTTFEWLQNYQNNNVNLCKCISLSPPHWVLQWQSVLRQKRSTWFRKAALQR